MKKGTSRKTVSENIRKMKVMKAKNGGVVVRGFSPIARPQYFKGVF